MTISTRFCSRREMKERLLNRIRTLDWRSSQAQDSGPIVPQSFPGFLSALKVTGPLGPDLGRDPTPAKRLWAPCPLSSNGRSPDPPRSSVPPIRGVAHADPRGPDGGCLLSGYLSPS